MAIEPRLLGALHIFGLGVATDRNEPRGLELRVRPEHASHFVTVHPGQPDVAQHEVRSGSPRLSDGSRAIVSDLNLVAVYPNGRVKFSVSEGPGASMEEAREWDSETP